VVEADVTTGTFAPISTTQFGYIDGVVDYGMDPTGSTFSTTALQNAIDATPVGGTLYVRGGAFKLSGAREITKNIRILGGGISGLWGSLNSQFNAIDFPGVSPYLAGTVFVQTLAGADCFDVPVTGCTVNFKDFGILFASQINPAPSDALMFKNTGNGIKSISGGTYGGLPDLGMTNSHLENVWVFGHDGNHYAFDLTNAILVRGTSLKSFGGGLLHFVQNGGSVGGNPAYFGNSYFEEIYGQVIAGGSAHGIFLDQQSLTLTAMRFDHPQVTVADYTGQPFSPTAPTSVQAPFYVTSNTLVEGLSIGCPDFETNVGSVCQFGYGATLFTKSGNFFGMSIDPGGYGPTISYNEPIFSPGYARTSGGLSPYYMRQVGDYVLAANGSSGTKGPAEIYSIPGSAGAGLRIDGTGMYQNDAGPIASARGATGARPATANLVEGALWFDTTLGIPIFVNAALTGWVNAVGTPV
jgi:hypothetical protein